MLRQPFCNHEAKNLDKPTCRGKLLEGQKKAGFFITPPGLPASRLLNPYSLNHYYISHYLQPNTTTNELALLRIFATHRKWERAGGKGI